MLPVIHRFTFDTPTTQALLFLALAALGGWSVVRTWVSTAGLPNDQRLSQTLTSAAVALGVTGFVLWYALPQVPLLGLKGRGEGIPIHTYGVLLVSGFMVAVTVSGWLAEREWPGALGARRRDDVSDLAFWLFVGGILGARLLFVVVNWKDYAANPARFFSVEGGLVFYGGLIGGAVALVWFCTSRGIELLRMFDLALPTVSIAQALGRLGCFSAGCCWGDIAREGTPFTVHFPGTHVTTLFGLPSSVPSMAFSSQQQSSRYVVEATGQVVDAAQPGAVAIAEWVARHDHTLAIYPTQLFESAGQILIFLAMMLLRPYRRFHGQMAGLWLMSYAVLRSTVELFRGDDERGTLHALVPSVPLGAWYDLSISQFISLCLFAVGAALIARGVQQLRASPPPDVASLATA